MDDTNIRKILTYASKIITYATFSHRYEQLLFLNSKISKKGFLSIVLNL